MDFQLLCSDTSEEDSSEEESSEEESSAAEEDMAMDLATPAAADGHANEDGASVAVPDSEDEDVSSAHLIPLLPFNACSLTGPEQTLGFSFG